METKHYRSAVITIAAMVVIVSGCSADTSQTSVVFESDSSTESIDYEYFEEFSSLMKPDYIKGVSFDERTEESDNEGMTYQYLFKVNSTVSRTEAMREYYRAVKDVKTDESDALRVYDGDGEDPLFSGLNYNDDGTYNEYIVRIDYDNINKFYVTILIDYHDDTEDGFSEGTSVAASRSFMINGKWTATETIDSNASFGDNRNEVPYGDVWVRFQTDGAYEWYSQGLIVKGDYIKSDDAYLLQYNGELIGIASGLSGNKLLLNIVKNGSTTNMSYILEKD